MTSSPPPSAALPRHQRNLSQHTDLQFREPELSEGKGAPSSNSENQNLSNSDDIEKEIGGDGYYLTAGK